MTDLRKDGTKMVSLSSDQFADITRVLQRFRQTSKCSDVILCDTSGLAVAHCGPMNGSSKALLSSLAAGNLAATSEMAKLVGEKEGFKVQFHEGKQENIYVTSINDEFFLAVIFPSKSTFGMIRVLTARSVEELIEILARTPVVDSHGESEITEKMGNSEFTNELEQQLDSVLFGHKKLSS